jgi:hypothetical protein
VDAHGSYFNRVRRTASRSAEATTVFLSLDAFEAIRDSGEPVLAEGHVVSQAARARRLRSATQALRTQAEHQVTRAKKNLGLM